MSEPKQDKAFLDARKQAQELANKYKQDRRQQSFNLLLLGEMGSGKTFMIRTARKPVHIDSFDPGGSKGLEDFIESGDIIVDSRYESEKPLKPFAFTEWKSVMDSRIRSGYFNHIGTYVLDSSTTWAKAIMNSILKKAGLAGSSPRFTKDYQPQKTAIENAIYEMLDLPCDFILTGHLEPFKDEAEGGRVRFRYMTTGKGALVIPTLFDEVWTMDPKQSSAGVEYRVLTQNTGTFTCRSRLAKEGRLNQYEKPDIKAILKKVGRSSEDLPKLID
jgi:hypothetical protein